MARHHAPSRLATLLARPPTFWVLLSLSLLLVIVALGVAVAPKGVVAAPTDTVVPPL